MRWRQSAPEAHSFVRRAVGQLGTTIQSALDVQLESAANGGPAAQSTEAKKGKKGKKGKKA